MDQLRNFCIIAHIDHGKSTLADRFLEETQTLTQREMKNTQMLDTMELEQERGITIKLQPARMNWNHTKTQEEFILNLIDTPGHVDFQYEVSRSLAACEGAILVVDAAQGIEAQTLATVYMAIENDLEIIPVINKIDLPNADPDKVAQEIEDVFGFPKELCLRVSGKSGVGVHDLLDSICDLIPVPSLSEEEHTRALIFDSFFDPYKGVIAYVRVMDGEIKKGMKVHMCGTDSTAEALEVGYMIPMNVAQPSIKTGEIGYVVTGLKDVSQVRVGDTISSDMTKEARPLAGYKPAVPMVYAGIFTIDTEDYPLLRDALSKLLLSDSSLIYEPETSKALGFGFRCGFLGLLHMEIIQERLDREFNLNILVTTPTVRYVAVLRNGEEVMISNPSEMPDIGSVEEIKQPWAKIEVIVPESYIGAVMKLCDEKHGVYMEMKYIDKTRVNLIYEIPMGQIVTDFFDTLKSVTSGYASLTYEEIGLRVGQLVKMDILIAGDVVDSLSLMCEKGDAHHIGIDICLKLKEVIPRQMFPVAIQSAIGSRIVARETIPAMRKDVTAKLYGGDVSRKKKLLAKQKEGKKRMKAI
ncbi:MAG: translation elongation factor 4 [Patescibacteria group bacterium]|nr:translation elongation factor 4 [Patescibacteria group bacterium]